MQRPTTVMGRRLADRALAMVGDGVARTVSAKADAIDLTTPMTAEPPLLARDAAKAALDQGETHYVSGAGLLDLRRAIAERATADGFPTTADSVIVTNGGSEALYIALQSILRAGDRVLVGGPIAPNLRTMIDFIGAEVVTSGGDWTTSFAPEPEYVRAAGARVLLLASPSPVTGQLIPTNALEAAIWAAREQEMVVILDRSLAWCCYEPDAAKLDDASLGTTVLTTGSFSDAYALSGWRVGYLAVPDAQLAAPVDLKVSMSICTSPISQRAAQAVLEGADDWLAERRAAFKARRDLASDVIRKAGLDVIVPDAWPPLVVDTRSIDPDDRRVVERLRNELGVIVEPGSRFGNALRGFVRLRLDCDTAALQKPGMDLGFSWRPRP